MFRKRYRDYPNSNAADLHVHQQNQHSDFVIQQIDR